MQEGRAELLLVYSLLTVVDGLLLLIILLDIRAPLQPPLTMNTIGMKAHHVSSGLAHAVHISRPRANMGRDVLPAPKTKVRSDTAHMVKRMCIAPDHIAKQQVWASA